MNPVYAEIELSNAASADVEPITVRAVADTTALMLCIPERVAARLRLEHHRRKVLMLAGGRYVHEIDYVGPMRVRFGDRWCFVGAYVIGDEVLMGSIPMDSMDLVIDDELGHVRGKRAEGPLHRSMRRVPLT